MHENAPAVAPGTRTRQVIHPSGGRAPPNGPQAAGRRAGQVSAASSATMREKAWTLASALRVGQSNAYRMGGASRKGT